MNTVGQLLRWLRDSGVEPDAAILIQAYGKAAKHDDWTVHLVAGSVVICADLARARRHDRCPICGGTEFEPALVNHGDAYSGCIRCALKASE